MLAAQQVDQFRQADDCEGFRHAQPDRSPYRVVRAGPLLNLTGGREQGRRVLEQDQSLVGEAERPPQALEQHGPQCRLQIAEAERDGRLREVEVARRVPDRAELRDPIERLQLCQREAHPDPSSDVAVHGERRAAFRLPKPI